MFSDQESKVFRKYQIIKSLIHCLARQLLSRSVPGGLGNYELAKDLTLALIDQALIKTILKSRKDKLTPLSKPHLNTKLNSKSDYETR